METSEGVLRCRTYHMTGLHASPPSPQYKQVDTKPHSQRRMPNLNVISPVYIGSKIDMLLRHASPLCTIEVFLFFCGGGAYLSNDC